MKHVAIGQSGGPTAVINATLAGFVRELYKDHAITFVVNGYEGLANQLFLEADDALISNVMESKKVPGAFLGAGRYEFDEEKIKESVQNLRRQKINTLVFIGGNGTMEALKRIEEEAKQQNYTLQVIGLPKTVDNDLAKTDHAPGFGSAAKYAALAARDMSRDLQAMSNFEQVRILETMGRNAGWLTAAAGFLNDYKQDGPHVISLPEDPLSPDVIMKKTTHALEEHGTALIIVSEGASWEKGQQVERDRVQGRSVLGGVSKEIENLIKQNMDVMVRSELLGMNQRSFSAAVSSTDFNEAVITGETGASWVREKKTGVMVSLQRADTALYHIDYVPVALHEVAASGERILPPSFIQNQKAYNEWLRPLVGSDVSSYPPPLKRRNLHVIEQNKSK
ncbi:diphosphate--fructose-6-phosphate 1-phosphotransferase [Salibacterium qingdaonense]|uniref:6-phosphofructokinase 1 n=1 Tax=Salibacterium qingdaonense TaxID=266892 RepID=A0A1I4NIQ3_9BACI|nr:diphosphate--fructose-6-phosphate 1-phosphotransferase [Salibacterium qingdaonense]SFM15422.1 6-phosphofructokinase 1 [Salibacterium qingdaonense]